MPDHIRYDLLTQKALRGVVREVLAEAARKGLAGEHHFFVSFDTRSEGVRLSERMRAQYPEEMTIVLQHQFWDLTVDEQGFSVGLSFGGVPEKLAVPFAAIKGFFDPSVQFGLQFEEVAEGEASQEAPAQPVATPAGKKRLPPAPVSAAAPASKPSAAPAAVASEPGAEKPDKPDSPATGGEVVRLDRFRKK